MSQASSYRSLALMNFVSLIITITTNFLANALPINGKTTGELSDLYPNYFTPSGFTFSIWGVIYLFLLGFVIYQAILLFRINQPFSAKIADISPYFITNCLLNASWILAWHYEYVSLSLVIICGLLITLIIIQQKLGLPYEWRNIKSKLLVDAPFSLYLGWITIATIANTTALLTKLEWDGGGLSPVTWTKIMIAAGTAICLAVLAAKNNLFFALVVLWAFYGIIVKRGETSDTIDATIITFSQVCMMIIFLAIIVGLVKNIRRKKMPIIQP